MARALIAGAALGVLSRIEEVTPGFSLAISSNATWLAAGVLAAAPVRGAAVLTCANAAYYAWVGLVERIPLAAAAPSPGHWIALGVAAGLVCGALGRRTGHPLLTAAAVWLAVTAGDAFGLFAALLP